jgi:hypothetical protein
MILRVEPRELSADFAQIELVSCPRNKHILRCDQNGPPARRSEPDWQLEGAYLERYVTDPAAAGQPPAHFHRNPLGRGQFAVFPSGVRRTRSSRIDSDMIVARSLKNSQLTCGERNAYFGDRTAT